MYDKPFGLQLPMFLLRSKLVRKTYKRKCKRVSYFTTIQITEKENPKTNV